MKMLQAVPTVLALTMTAASAGQPEYLNSGRVLPTDLPFSEAVRVGDTVYLSGQIGVRPGTLELVDGGIEAETRRTMENIRLTLEANGLGLENLVKCLVMLEDIDEWGRFNDVYRTFFPQGRFPARSALGADGLALGARVEVECLAVVPDAALGAATSPRPPGAPPPVATAPDSPTGSAAPYHLPLPDGWGEETLTFPLDFAPSLPYAGLEELRFAPGFFDETAEDLWSYAFIWWVEDASGPELTRLTAELIEYFGGLSRMVAATNEIAPGTVTETAVQLKAGGSGAFEGTIRTFDSFTTHAPITLNAEIQRWRCEEAARDVVFFALSPQPSAHGIWRALEGIRAGFACPED